MSTKLSAESIATLIAALCASTAIACGGSAATTAPPVTAKEVAPARHAPLAEEERTAESASPREAESPPAADAETGSAPREALLASPPADEAPPAPAAETPRAAPKKAPARKKAAAAAQGGCGAGTCA